MKKLTHSLIFLFLLICAGSTAWCQDSIPQIFLEKLVVPNTFEFYTIITNDSVETVNRSKALNKNDIGDIFREDFLENEFIHSSNRKLDHLYYLTIELDHLSIYKEEWDGKLIDSVKVFGTVELTNYGGQVLLLKSIEDIVKDSLPTEGVYESGKMTWVLVMKEEFVEKMSQSLSEKISNFLMQIDSSQLKSSEVELEVIQLKNQEISDSVELANLNTQIVSPWENECNKSIVGIVGKHGVSTGLLLDNSGYFVCDMKSLPRDSDLRIIDFYGNRIKAEIIAVDKRLELAIGRIIGKQINYNPRPVSYAKLQVGSEFFFRGYTGVPYLPIICGTGKTIGKMNGWGFSGYLLNANYSDNMSGSPIFNADGKVIGITVSNSNSNGFKKPVFLCYTMTQIYEIFNIKPTSEIILVE